MHFPAGFRRASRRARAGKERLNEEEGELIWHTSRNRVENGRKQIIFPNEFFLIFKNKGRARESRVEREDELFFSLF